MTDRRRERAPWLVWAGGERWQCLRCGAFGTLPFGCSMRTLVVFLDCLEREHRGCREPATSPASPSPDPESQQELDP